jgi:hypothetical protein
MTTGHLPTVTERRRAEQGDKTQPDLSTSTLSRPGVMTGHPLCPREQEHVDRLADAPEAEACHAAPRILKDFCSLDKCSIAHGHAGPDPVGGC